MTAAENIPHLSAAEIVTGTLRDAPCGPGSSRGPRNAVPKCAARSRATPRCPQQSGRLRVRSRSNTVSCSIPRTSKGSLPSGVSPGRSSRPEASSEMPSSTGEHSIPSESIPRMPRREISRPSGMRVPSVASGTTSPGPMLVAPHQTWRSVPSPASTQQRVTLAASGCFSVRTIRAVTTPATGTPTVSVDSTAMPSVFIADATTSGSSGSSASSRRMESRTFTRTAP